MIHKLADLDKSIKFQFSRIYNSNEEWFDVINLLNDYLNEYTNYYRISLEDTLDKYHQFVNRYIDDLKYFEKYRLYPFQIENSSEIHIDRTTYDIFLILSALVTKHRFQIMKNICKIILEAENCLIVGVGSGLELALLKDKFIDIDAYDMSISDFCKNKFSRLNLFEEIYESNLLQSYDAIFAIELLEHLEYPYKILHDFSKSLRKNGRLIITTAKNVPQFDHLYNFVNENEFGAALHYFTGSKAHNIKIRDLAKRKGLKINEYGVFKGEKMIAGKNEEDVFKSVGLPFIIPEIRRNNGEIVYGLEHKKFPKFVELSDIQGDLHSHSTYSDGKNSIKEMANAFIERGYKYFAVTDHSSVMGVTGGMGKKDIASQWKEIDRLNKKFANKIKILKGVEVDILKDGSLDFADDVLEKLDVVIIAAHMYNRLDEKEQTARLIAAIENPHSNILAHPTGRIINRRAEIKINMEKIIDACIANNVALEINSSPLRLDLSDQYIKLAKDKGASFSINTDSHNTDHVDFIKYGLGTARRGWLEKKDVLNTLSLQNLTASLKRV